MKNLKEVVMGNVFLLAACVSVVIVMMICGFLFAKGLPTMVEIGVGDFLLGTKWKPSIDVYGITPMILGSFYVTVGALVIGVPVGILTAIFMAYFCPEKPYGILKPAVELLAGIPSVVYGFFGLVMLVPLVRDNFGGTGFGILTASILLGIMLLPTVISVAEAALRAVPKSYYEGALALGADHTHSVFSIIVPAAKSGIFAAIVLGIGRAIGETMAVIMVAGNQARIPQSLLDGVRTMTANIVIEMGYATDLHRDALIATAVVLFIFIVIINVGFSHLKGKVVQGE